MATCCAFAAIALIPKVRHNKVMRASFGSSTMMALMLVWLMVIGTGCRKDVAQSPHDNGDSTKFMPETPSTAAPIDEADIAVHADIQAIIEEIYGGGRLIEHSEIYSDVEVIYQRTYDLQRAHEADDDAKLEDAMKQRGYTIDQRMPTESLGISAHKDSIADADILVSATAGSNELSVSITHTQM